MNKLLLLGTGDLARFYYFDTSTEAARLARSEVLRELAVDEDLEEEREEEAAAAAVSNFRSFWGCKRGVALVALVVVMVALFVVGFPPPAIDMGDMGVTGMKKPGGDGTTTGSGAPPRKPMAPPPPPNAGFLSDKRTGAGRIGRGPVVAVGLVAAA